MMPCVSSDAVDVGVYRDSEEAKSRGQPQYAKICDTHGLEDHGNESGGPLSGAHIKHLDKDTFKNGIHKPNFHDEGLHKPMVSGKKKFDSGFHYLLHCHDLGGKTEDGSYGGKLCTDPYGPEVKAIVDKLLEQAKNDKTLCYNNFKDPCPELTKEQVALCKGFDYGDKTKKLPIGPLPWPTGLPEPGYVPKTDPLHGRWITVQGGQKEFIKAAIKAGMLGKAEADKIIADTDHHQTGGMYLRINQFGDTCTVDASVAKFARAKRTWRSGHYFYEPLVSGGNLFGVWVLPEEYRKIGFFWEMESGRCFRIERRAFPAGKYMFLRQATEVDGNISFVFYVKVSNDPGSKPIPVQSRDYTALAGQNNTKDNLGNKYPCTAKDIDYPKKRDTWLDTNMKEMLVQRKLVANTFARVSSQEHIGMGYSTEELTGISVDGLWEALAYKARNAHEFMDVEDVVVQDRSGFLWRSMYVKAAKKKLVEHIYCNERAGEMVYRVVDFNTKREGNDERVIAIKENPLRMEFYHRHKSDGYRSYWHAPVNVVKNLTKSIVSTAQKLENNKDTTVGLGFHSREITECNHDALWKAMLMSVREPGRFTGARVQSIKEKEGYVARITTLDNGPPITENIYAFETNCEVVYRLVDKRGKETEVERVIALRAHPLQLEFHCRNRKDGFRVRWPVAKDAVQRAVENYVNEATRLESKKPECVGYGATSDPITGSFYDSLFIAIDKTITDPSLAGAEIVKEDTEITEMKDYILRKFTIAASGEKVVERVSIFEEVGEFIYCRLNADGSDGEFERVLAIHTGPLRLELYERNTVDKMRLSWKAPYQTATSYFARVIELAKEVDRTKIENIGYGMSSKPMTGTNSDSIWKAMQFCVRDPTKFGMDVSDVKVTDNAGYMTRVMTLNGKPGKPSVTDNIYVNEQAQEILYRNVDNGVESKDERVFVVRQDPLRCEIFMRHSTDRLRVYWKAPRTVAKTLFDGVTKFAQLMYNDPKSFAKKYGRRVSRSRQGSNYGIF